MGRNECCEVCDAPGPRWLLLRRGDVVVSWACDDDLAQVADRLQRDFEVTELVLRNNHKAHEWAAISKSLNKIAGET